MHRTEGDGYVTGNGKYDSNVHFYADEDPGVRDATQVRHQEVNAIQEEIVNVIRGAGIALNAPGESYAQMCQLELAINQLIAAEATARAAADAAINATIAGLTSSSIANASGVSGGQVTDALNTLNINLGNKLPKNGLVGLQIICDSGSTPDTWVDVNTGECLDYTNNYKIVIPSRLRKRIDAAWAPGDNVGGWAGSTPTIRTGMYHYAFVLYRTSDGAVEFGYDDNPVASNLTSISGYNRWRRVGAFYVAAGPVVRGFRQRGDWFFHYDDPISETIDLSTGSGGFIYGNEFIYPNPDAAFGNRHEIGEDLMRMMIGLEPPSLNNVYACVYPYGNSYAEFDGSSDYWDAARTSAGITHMTTYIEKPFLDSANPHGRFMVLSNGTPGSACNIKCWSYGYEDSRGKHRG